MFATNQDDWIDESLSLIVCKHICTYLLMVVQPLRSSCVQNLSGGQSYEALMGDDTSTTAFCIGEYCD